MFETFDLGRAIATAESIKGLRRQSTLDRLQAQTMESNLATAEQARTAAANKISDDQRLQDMTILYRVAGQVENSDDPLATTQAILRSPEIVQVFQRHGVDPYDISGMSPEQVKAGAAQLRQMYEPFLPPDEDLVQTVGQDGQPVLTPKRRAAGMRPYLPPKDNSPSSYEEFVRAQRDPAFAAFLKSRRGKGLSVTMPDGTVIEMGGDGSRIGPGELGKPLVNKLQETIVNSQDRLDRLNGALTQFNPDFFRAKGIANVWGARLKDFAGMDLTASQKQFLQDYAGFQTSLKNDLSQYLHQISGAAISPEEYERLSKAAPTGDELSPAEFKSKATATIKDLTRATMRANWALKNGIGVQSAEQLARAMPLDGIDQVFEQRANSLWQQMGGTPETRQQAIQQARQEFGMVR